MVRKFTVDQISSKLFKSEQNKIHYREEFKNDINVTFFYLFLNSSLKHRAFSEKMKNNVHDKDSCFQFGLDILIN